MVLFIRQHPLRLTPNPTAVVIPAAAHASHVTACALLDTAEAERQAILTEARRAFEAEHARGYLEGLDEGRAEAARHMVGVVASADRYLAGLEHELAGLVLDSMRWLLADYAEEERIGLVVRKALAGLRAARTITLRVAPDRVAEGRAALVAVQADFPRLDLVEVAPDAAVSGDVCVVETDIGVTEISLQAQLASLMEEFHKGLEPRLGKG